VEQPRTASARRANAETVRQKLRLTAPILLDTMDNAARAAYGAGENGAVVIGRDGTVVLRQRWFEPGALRRAVDKAIAARPPTP
jgi:hypothetical protein